MSSSINYGELLLSFTPLPDVKMEYPVPDVKMEFPNIVTPIPSLHLYFQLSYEVCHKVTSQLADGKQYSTIETTDKISTETLWTSMTLFNNSVEIYKIFTVKLAKLGIRSDVHRRRVILGITERVKRMKRSVPKRRKVMVIDVVLVLEKVHRMFETEVIDRVVKNSGITFDNVNYGTDLNSIRTMMRIVKIGEQGSRTGNEEERECKICLKGMVGFVLGMPCEHVFHANCILGWLKINRSCPLCCL